MGGWGVCVSYAFSFDNTWELVQTDVNAGETYNIFVKAYSFSAPMTYYGIAWAVDTYGSAANQ